MVYGYTTLNYPALVHLNPSEEPTSGPLDLR